MFQLKFTKPEEHHSVFNYYYTSVPEDFQMLYTVQLLQTMSNNNCLRERERERERGERMTERSGHLAHLQLTLILHCQLAKSEILSYKLHYSSCIGDTYMYVHVIRYIHVHVHAVLQNVQAIK